MRTAIMGRSGLCPGVPRARWGGEPLVSHLVGLQQLTLQDCSDRGSQEI